MKDYEECPYCEGSGIETNDEMPWLVRECPHCQGNADANN
jgi:DnaJ-class molecular chaperone